MRVVGTSAIFDLFQDHIGIDIGLCTSSDFHVESLSNMFNYLELSFCEYTWWMVDKRERIPRMVDK